MSRGGDPAAKLLSKNEVRRAANIAELPKLLGRTSCPPAMPGISYMPVSRVRHRMIDSLR
jgi:hypothetical protein